MWIESKNFRIPYKSYAYVKLWIELAIYNLWWNGPTIIFNIISPALQHPFECIIHIYWYIYQNLRVFL